MCSLLSKMYLLYVAIVIFSVIWNVKAFGYVKPLDEVKACQLIQNQYWNNYETDLVLGEKLGDVIQKGNIICNETTNRDVKMLVNYLTRVEVFMNCKFIEYLGNWLFLLDVLKNEVIIKYQDKPNKGFDEINNTNWIRYWNAIEPILNEARIVTARWYGTFQRLVEILPTPDDQAYLTQATLSLNIFINGSFFQSMTDSDNHQKFLKIMMIRATIQDILYRYSRNNCVLAFDEWNPRSNNELSSKENLKDIVPTKMLGIIKKLESFGEQINFVSEEEVDRYYMPHVIFTNEILNPDMFVVDNESVRWLWNDAKRYPCEAYDDLKTEFRGLLFAHYKVLSVFTVIVTFYGYLADYLKIYITHVMTTDTTFFDDQDDPDNHLRAVRTWFHKLSEQIGRIQYTNSLVEIHRRINDSPKEHGRMSVQDLLLMLQAQLNALNFMVDFTGSRYKIKDIKKETAVDILKSLHETIENYINSKIANTDFPLLKTIPKYI